MPLRGLSRSIPALRAGFARPAASALRTFYGRRSPSAAAFSTDNNRRAAACCPCRPPAGPALIPSQVDSLTVHPQNTLASWDTQLGADLCLDMIAAVVKDPDAVLTVCCGSAQGLRSGGGSGAFSPVHPIPRDSLAATAAANAAFVSSPRVLIREPPFSGQLTGPGGKGSSSMFVGPSRPRSAAARALLAGTTLHPVVQLGWQPLCEVHCNGCAPARYCLWPA